ncbi:MAG: DUF5681 domain-containing protein [Candidatus Paceibacterota bacterium]
MNSNSPDITGKNRSKQANKGQFQPGTTGNPMGRPKGSLSITQAIKDKLQEVYPGSDRKIKKTYLDKIVEGILKNAIEKGDTRSQKDIWAYIDGQPKVELEINKFSVFSREQLIERIMLKLTKK